MVQKLEEGQVEGEWVGLQMAAGVSIPGRWRPEVRLPLSVHRVVLEGHHITFRGRHVVVLLRCGPQAQQHPRKMRRPVR